MNDMSEHIEKLKFAELFKGLNSEELSSITRCIHPKYAVFEKGTPIAMQGDMVPQAGIILHGKAVVQVEHISGDTLLLEEIKAFDMFAAAMAGSGVAKMPVSIWAATETAVFFFDINRTITTCKEDCYFHKKLVENMFRVLSKKLLSKTRQVSILKNTTTREKLMAFFEVEIEKARARHFTISLNRSELAGYIGVNRSSMSRELSNMQKEGLIEYKGNSFCVKK